MKSIRRDLTITLGTAFCMLLLAGDCGIFFVTKSILSKQFDQTLAAKASALITATEIDDGELEIDLTVQDFAGFGTGGHDYFEILRADRSVLAASPSLLAEGAPPLPRHFPGAGNKPRFVSGRLADGRAARFHIQRFAAKDDENGKYDNILLIAASPTDSLSRDLRSLGMVILGVSACVLAAAIPLLRAGLRKGLRPLSAFGKEVAAIPPSRLNRQLDLTNRPEELHPLGESLNGWLSRMRETFERERRFSSHAAHELRTPLAELRTTAEVGSTWPDGDSPRRFSEILAITGEMESLLDKLSLLARTDAGAQPVTICEVDLSSTIDMAVSRSGAEGKGIVVSSHVVPGSFRTDPVLWSAILNNLIGNAVAHAPEGSRVELSASPHFLQILNPAPMLTKEDLPRLFERFWRKNPSHDGGGHSGLGLPLVRSCVSFLGGNCSLFLDDGPVFRVRIEWENEETKGILSSSSH